MHTIRPWKKTRSEPLGDFHVFNLRRDWKISPRTNHELDFYVLECTNWVNVIALTPERQLVMVEQYRHGSDTVELEIPGGVMDAADVSPEATAARELREETGYEGRDARRIGQVFSNPAIMNNTTFTVLIEDCRCQHEVQFDHGEDLITRLVPVQEVPGLVASGKIRHSLVVAALFYFDLWLRGSSK